MESPYLHPQHVPGDGARRTARALAAGLAGFGTITALNEGARRVWAGAPRIEMLGERAVGRLARRAGRWPRKGERYFLALAGSLLSDASYFALAGLAARRFLAAGWTLGALAGAGAVLLPGPLGLGTGPTRRTRATALATVAWYVAAGIAAGAAARALARRR